MGRQHVLATNLEHVLPTTRARVLTRVGRRDEAEYVLAMLAPSRTEAMKAAFPLDFALAYQRDAGPYR